MASHLSAIGFPIGAEEEFRGLVVKAAAEAQPVGTGTYSRWAPGEGVELWVQVSDQAIVGVNPHFAGSGRMRVGVSALLPDPEYPMDGKVQGWADPTGPGGEGGAYPLVFDLPDFALAAEKARVGAVVTVQLAGFAHDLTCYDSDAAFEAAQAAVKFAPESFVPVGLMDDGGGQAAVPEALAILAGHVLSARLAVNPVSQRPFHVLSVRTIGGTIDLVADPDSVTGAPVVGGVVHGTFWLSGRLVPEPNRRGIFPVATSV